MAPGCDGGSRTSNAALMPSLYKEVNIMKSKLCFLSVIGILILFAADLNAQVKAGSFSVSPFFGYSKFTNDSPIEGSSIYGGSLGYNLSENFGLEASYNNIDSKIRKAGIREAGSDPDGPGPAPAEPGEIIVPGGAKVTGSQLRLEGLFYFYSGEKLAPYAALGIGTLTYDYSGKSYGRTNMPVGFGLKYFITDKIAIRADFRDVLRLPENNLLVTVGATFHFGGR